MTQTLHEVFGGAERKFRLAIGELRELQEKCEAGPATILARLMSYQPQSEFLKRPHPKDFDLGENDSDYISALNVFALVRNFGGDWRVDDVREPIRLGLIGGGITPTDAWVAVSRYVDTRPLTEHISLAAAILLKALSEDKDDAVGKTEVETTEPKAETDA
ncbi:gene transfer agent family protein [Mesorhizobium sp. CAU 1732]|uniref:gene transfer agent family protein n=1 Tax=Mesorhizobium sp. CAU 1732 TaxID=3140358 RepID=UPI003260D42E